jgi:hypothetical protein
MEVDVVRLQQLLQLRLKVTNVFPPRADAPVVAANPPGKRLL